MGVLIENKSRGCSLDDKYVRSKKVGEETPYEQAKWYADNLPYSIRPRWIITCNFDEIRIHDLDKQNPGSEYTSVTLDELPDALYLFGFFTDKENSRIEKEKRLSVKAGELVGRLYDELAAQYQSLGTDKHEQRSLNVLCVRLVFLLYAEDSGLLAKRRQFYDYLKTKPANRLRSALMELFEVLDTPESERDPYLDPELAAFPYINGGLFTHEDIVVPQLTDQFKVDLLAEASAGFNWKDISPTIFGAAFESTLNPETRRAGGMHYTSPENIHKVIDPLFLDDLKAELAEIEGEKVERTRVQRLRMFQRKLASLNFLDPASGSHNFLTETYLSLRKLELRVIENLQGDQTSFDLIDNPIMVNIGQFYAIEINDFAVSVGKTALWIAEQQMMEKTQELLPFQTFEFLPLKSITNSVGANALRIDWNDVLPAERCSYIISNPPFLGSSVRSKEQTADMEVVFEGEKKWGKCDYCVAWYKKAADYMRDTKCRAAFVSTNSITQGEQVEPTWRRLFEQGIVINFARQTFVWNNEASDQAHVHCVIIGFSYERTNKVTLYNNEKSEVVSNINGYLANAPSVFLQTRSKAVDGNHAFLTQGSKVVDGGNLILSEKEARDFCVDHPSLADVVRLYIGGKELLNGGKRYCFWLKDTPKDTYAECFEIRSRLELVKEVRLSSPTKEFNQAASTPHLFVQDRQPDTSYLALPKVSSERREYLPAAWLDSSVVATDQLWISPDATLYDFGLISSKMHNAWMRIVAGRLESRYRYSPVVYNTFIYPNPTSEQKEHIETCAQLVLDAREQFPDKSLADLYDPDKMPSDLLAAHKALDSAVEAAYGVDFDGDEGKIVAHLFKLYAEMTGA